MQSKYDEITGTTASMPKFEVGAPSSLMRKIGAFLPQMAAANQELEERVALDKNHAQHIQIDVTLKKDITNGGEDEEDDEDSNASHHSDEGAEDGEKRSIEMTVALGDFDSNPIIPLLASDNTEIDNQTNNEGNYAEREQEHYNEVQEREPGDVISLSNILRVGGGANLCEEGEGAQRSTSDTSSLLTDRATKRKKVLIEEISSV